MRVRDKRMENIQEIGNSRSRLEQKQRLSKRIYKRSKTK